MATAGKGGYVFTYFRNADDGCGWMRLISRDGRKFTAMPGGNAVIVPGVGENKRRSGQGNYSRRG